MWVYTHRLKSSKSTQGGKQDPHRLYQIKWPYNSSTFKIYQKHSFLCGKKGI